MSIGAKMAGGNPASGARQGDDFYPTPPEVTKALVDHYSELNSYTIWEPCAGDGAMVDVLAETNTQGIMATDLVPRRPGITKLDFLTEPCPFTSGIDAIITNPPFNLAPEMIEKALSYKPLMVAFVLKSTFWHAARRWPLFQKHPPAGVHPLLWRPDFLKLGAPTMEVMWCVWRKGQARDLTRYVPFPKPRI